MNKKPPALSLQILHVHYLYIFILESLYDIQISIFMLLMR